MREQLRIGSRTNWVCAWLLALAGPVVYRVSPDDLRWWVGVLLVMALLGLALWRQDREGVSGDYGESGALPPWGPP
jgi:hypothetical protein